MNKAKPYHRFVFKMLFKQNVFSYPNTQIIHISSLEVDSDVEVFEMKHEIVSLQTKIEDGMCILTPLFYAEAFSF